MYTAYPRWKVDRLPRSKVSTFPWLLTPMMAVDALSRSPVLNYHAITSFDHWMARRIEPCEVFHSLSSYAVQSHQAAKNRYGALTVCDRGSSHILYQESIVGHEYELQGMPFRGFSRRGVERELWEYANCDLIFVPSSFAYRTFVAQGVPESKLRLNPFGADLNRFHPVPRQDDVFRVVYVGALSIRKGIPYLLEALAPLSLPRFEIWLIGPRMPETKRLLARYEGRFRYLGVISNGQLFRYYSQCSVFVIASIEEGLAMVQPQAMACGLPIVATTNTGAEDLITDGVEGFIVAIRDPQAIRDRVLRLYRDPDLRDEMARAAKRRIESINGWDDFGERAISSYRAALQGKTDDAGKAE
ncbi:MAG TPA: glycosyltransferase family 4 protein [Candidatus Binataceae bacterium]|nr:glycosyltransferase family 4 protein [Candidatus Binataceae bacterium]